MNSAAPEPLQVDYIVDSEDTVYSENTSKGHRGFGGVLLTVGGLVLTIS